VGELSFTSIDRSDQLQVRRKSESKNREKNKIRGE